ncbi:MULTISPECIES: type VII secretion protein EssC [Bacillus]|uniref:type VII secretion protein EssC n=1 Tax=Bacillus TaxID=1386 RepID=UPI0002F6C72E|nr:MULTISPECIES: type VII secretion protein EssC [Bacillus]
MDLWIMAGSSLQKYALEDHEQQTLSVGEDLKDTIQIRSISFSHGSLQLKKVKNEWSVQELDREIGILTEDKPFKYQIHNECVSFFITKASEEKLYYLGNRTEVTFSKKKGDILVTPNRHFEFSDSLSLIKQGEKWLVHPENNEQLFLNGMNILTIHKVQNGDQIFFPFMTVTLLEGDFLRISTVNEYKSSLIETSIPTSKMKMRYPLFQRTPRLIYDFPKEKVTLSFPMQDAEEDSRGLWIMILPPLVMLLVIGFIAILNPRGIFMLISLVMFVMTIFTSSIQYFRDKKKHKLRSEKRLRVYTRYLEEKREELDALYQKQKQVADYHFPSFEEMKTSVTKISDRIWERTFDNADFLQLRIGRADVDSTYDVNLGSSDLANREIDHLIEESQQLVKQYQKVKNVPLSIQVSTGSIGLVGKKAIVMHELQQLIGQLAFFHSYHDIRFVHIFDEDDYREWEWLKWLPHFQLPDSFARGLIYNEKTRDQLLTSIYQKIRERDLDPENDKKKYMPHYIFIVSNRQLIAEHVIMEYLEGKKTNLGFSTIFVSDSKESLTENIHTLVQYINEREGEILIENKKAVHSPFYLDQHVHQGNEEFARMLGSLQHQIGMQNSIPEMVSFLQLFNAKNVEELQIKQNWKVQQSSQSLAVPIGLKGKDDLVHLNLHEKAHGPHGLVAGTTGSGKSEMLQTYILSLAVHFHPHEVAFLLIDYKGGGMAQPFKNMPHLLGTITNIEGSKNFSNRALASINSELKKRQRLFSEFQVNHIDDYTHLYKQKKASTPLPHLFLISDEFAELKSEEPEFIKELVSAARIGRSLGVHLILATQKPGGVIDNQIWSNSRFKISLKVQDESDSKEILKNADAAHITTTGRGYLQVGNNEVYELFQSAWSGASYSKESIEDEDEIALITDLGLIQISEVQTNSTRKQQKVSEIDVVVDRIVQTQNELGIEKVASPWLPPLQDRLFSPPLMIDEENEPVFRIALKDEPERQSQDDYEYEWIKDGSVIVFGSSGYGKSMTAISLITQFATAFSPEQLHFYIFDFGSGTLLPLKQLVHTADYFRIDEERKIMKFFAFMKQEMDERKQLFLQKEVSNISIYNALFDEKLPILFIVIDNYDLVREEMADYENLFTQFSRDGQALGIYFILTATRVNSVRQPLLNNFRTKVFHYLMDSTELLGVIGRTTFEQEPVPGRAIIKKDDAYFSQMYLPTKGNNDIELLKNLQELVQQFKAKYNDVQAPKPIPMLPITLSIQDFETQYSSEVNGNVIPIGLCEEKVTSVPLSLDVNPHLLVVGQFRKGKTNSLKVILHALVKNQDIKVGVFDNVDRGLSSFKKYENIHYIESKEEMTSWIDMVEGMMQIRNDQYHECLKNNEDTPVFDKVVFMVDSFSRFQQNSDSIMQDRLAKLMKESSHLGFSVIVAGNANDFSKGYDSFTTELKQIRQALLLMKKSDQNLFTLPFQRNEKEIQPGFGYLVENGAERLLQIPNCLVERGELIEQQR